MDIGKLKITPELKKRILIVFLILFSINGAVFIAKFIGFAAYHAGEAGYITEIDIAYRRPAWSWSGISGIAIATPLVTFQESRDMDPAEVLFRETFLFECYEPNIPHEVYATTVDPSTIDWNNIVAGTPADVDAYLGLGINETSSATSTFTNTMNIRLGPSSIDVPTVYTYVFGMSNTTTFGTGILKDAFGTLIFVSNVLDNWTVGYYPDPKEIRNFQMLLPIPNMTTTTYYFAADPFDDCPEGLGITGGDGNVIGNVSSSTGIRLQDAAIMIAGNTVLSDPFGFYNISAPVGEHVIAALKSGYEVYVGNVTVNASNTTIHNIIMTPVTDYIGPGQTDNTDTGPGQNDEEGPGIGPGIGPYLEEPKLIEGQDFVISIPNINRRIKIDNFIEETVSLYSFKDESVTLQFTIEGKAADLIELETDSMVLHSNSNKDLNMRIFGRGPLGVYNGTLEISGSLNDEIPIKIELTDKDLLNVQTLFVELDPIERKVTPGDIFKYKTTLRNLLVDTSYPVNLLFTITDPSGDNVYMAVTENVQLKTTFSILKNFKVPKDMKPGDYIISVQANYLNLKSTVSEVFKVTLPFYKYLVFGKIPLWWIMLAVAILLVLTGAGYWYYENVQSKKKYHLKVEYAELPKPGPRNVYVGKIAETDHKTYFNLENFKVHTIVAGSTGGGKSFAAQGIIEEMLLHDVAVIVFDPTAQWTGMLRKLTAKSILALYSIFGMKQAEAKSFNGNIRQIKDARELINLKKYMKPGEIQVFACHKLDPKDMDIYVANAIREVFHANFDESRELRLVLVFDEVHRLLPKFGGSGEGFLQIERACREFRKWGIGVMLVSQVLSDFVGQIKANINTEIQMRTRDEGDLDRIATRYGKDVLQSLVKATVGSGMVENPAYNRGKPYFVSFKPIRHSVERLTDDEIEQYNKYNDLIDQIQFELDALEKDEEQDVFDLKLELKLALDKVKSGNFNMVEIYIEGIRPRIDKLWSKIGKTPPKLERKKVDEATLKAELEKAKAEREKAEAEEEKKSPDKSGEKQDEKKEYTSFDLRTEFKDALNFANGQQVTTIQELIDVIPTTDANILSKSVNDQKNDVEAWVRNKLGVPSLANKLKGKKSRDEIIAVLEEEQKKPTKVPKPKEKEEDEKEKEEASSEEKPKEEKETRKEKPEHEKREKVWPIVKRKLKKFHTAKKRIHFLYLMGKKHPKDAHIKYALGIEYHKAKLYEKAERKYLAALQIVPDNQNIKKHLRMVRRKLKQKGHEEKPKSKSDGAARKEELASKKEVSPEQYFKLSDGTEIKSYNELKSAIK
ncbi:DUF87 domain-containing protein, partial [Candidatus Woesearchaeota archaeon]|nr:DUF87 domain-containing protein [Candidatus Woesearchaeota archaeon]